MGTLAILGAGVHARLWQEPLCALRYLGGAFGFPVGKSSYENRENLR